MPTRRGLSFGAGSSPRPARQPESPQVFKKLRDFLYLMMGISTRDPDPNELKWIKAQAERQARSSAQPSQQTNPPKPTPAAQDTPKP